jgi:flavin reductase (DIM6/NTAB) family NADH-FMN oxidoreductase RutF
VVGGRGPVVVNIICRIIAVKQHGGHHCVKVKVQLREVRDRVEKETRLLVRQKDDVSPSERAKRRYASDKVLVNFSQSN